MGWLKRIFRGSEKEEVEDVLEATVELDKLHDWVDEKADSEFQKIRPDIEAKFRQLREEKKKLHSELEELRDAELHNPNITEREKQIMQGNREAYISQHKQFLNMVEFSDDLTCKEVTGFCKNFEELLVKLAKSTAKGHLVMNEFFSNHAANVNRRIKMMGQIVSRVKETLEDSNLGVVELGDVHKAISDLRGKRKLVSEMGRELEVLDKKLENSNFLKQKLEKSIEQLKQTEDYSSFAESDRKRKELWSDLKQTEDEIGGLFSQLDRPMRKFERMLAENVNIFRRYIDNPMKALAEDENLVIMGLLEKMRSAIEQDRVELKDKEKDKALQRIANITKENLSDARTTYVEAKRSIKQIDDRMRHNRALQDMNDLQYKIEHTDNQIKILQDKIDHAKKTKERIDLERLRSEAQKKIKQSMGIEVTIRWQEDSHTASQSSSSE